MQELDALFYIVILIMSVVVHEVAHGYAAYYFGDTTARDQGRLTLNPIKHLDMFGSVIIPLILILTKAGFVFGWAKPVPYNPNNLSDRKRGTLWVASAGIIANLVLAVFFGLILRFAGAHLPGAVSIILSTIVFVNIVLAIFNLIPLPPLDGSKILFTLLGHRAHKVERFLETYALAFVLIFVFFIWRYVAPVIVWLFTIITGIHP